MAGDIVTGHFLSSDTGFCLDMLPSRTGGTLPAGVVNGVIGAAGAGEDELGDGHKGVPLLEQGLQNGGQGLRGVERGVVEEHDGTRLYLAGDTLGDL